MQGGVGCVIKVSSVSRASKVRFSRLGVRTRLRVSVCIVSRASI